MFCSSGTRTYARGTPEREQLKDWVDEAKSAGRWVIVSMHMPCLTVKAHGCASDPTITDMLIGKAVDLILSGHDHNYSRSHQLTGTAAAPVVVDRDGTLPRAPDRCWSPCRRRRAQRPNRRLPAACVGSHGKRNQLAGRDCVWAPGDHRDANGPDRPLRRGRGQPVVRRHVCGQPVSPVTTPLPEPTPLFRTLLNSLNSMFKAKGFLSHSPKSCLIKKTSPFFAGFLPLKKHESLEIL